MDFEIKKSFVKDTKKLPQPIKDDLRNLIHSIMEVDSIASLPQVKKLKGYHNVYRIRIGTYRVGVVLENQKLILVRFLHRKEVYRYFP